MSVAKAVPMVAGRFVCRQGDVLVRKVNQIPAKDKLKKIEPDPKFNATVLAYGEVTGHAHVLDREVTELFEEIAEDGAGTETAPRRYLLVDKPTSLRHDEHAAIALEPGQYEVRIQTEYTPMGLRNVAD